MTGSAHIVPGEMPFYSVEQIAKRWGCSKKHVRRLIKKGDLVALKVGHLVRVRLDDLYRYERMNRIA